MGDVPASITVTDGAQLDARGQDDMQDVVRYTPGVIVNRQTSSTEPFDSFGGFTIRRVGGNRVRMLVNGPSRARADHR